MLIGLRRKRKGTWEKVSVGESDGHTLSRGEGASLGADGEEGVVGDHQLVQLLLAEVARLRPELQLQFQVPGEEEVPATHKSIQSAVHLSQTRDQRLTIFLHVFT